MPEDEFGNGNGNGEYGEFGELDDLRELLAERADDVDDLVLVDMHDGDGFANVQIDGQWYGYDLEGFDDSLWEELFDYIEELDIEYVVYEG